jgi:hypothetical protein
MMPRRLRNGAARHAWELTPEGRGLFPGARRRRVHDGARLIHDVAAALFPSLFALFTRQLGQALARAKTRSRVRPTAIVRNLEGAVADIAWLI